MLLSSVVVLKKEEESAARMSCCLLSWCSINTFRPPALLGMGVVVLTDLPFVFFFVLPIEPVVNFVDDIFAAAASTPPWRRRWKDCRNGRKERFNYPPPASCYSSESLFNFDPLPVLQLETRLRNEHIRPPKLIFVCLVAGKDRFSF